MPAARSARARWIAPALGALVIIGAAVVAAYLWTNQRDGGPGGPGGPGAHPPPPPAVSARMDLPVVVMGADCAVLGAAAVDAAGGDAYCARINSQTEQTVWSSIPERLRAGR